jgi:hypothetical protein
VTAESGTAYTVLTFIVIVCIDPTADELLDAFDKSVGSFSVAEVVSSEIESNLESVSYVRRVSVEHAKRR